MADVTEMSAYRENNLCGPVVASVPCDEAEKASLRLVVSLMTFGPRATTRQFDAIVRRKVRPSVHARHG